MRQANEIVISTNALNFISSNVKIIASPRHKYIRYVRSSFTIHTEAVKLLCHKLCPHFTVLCWYLTRQLLLYLSYQRSLSEYKMFSTNLILHVRLWENLNCFLQKSWSTCPSEKTTLRLNEFSCTVTIRLLAGEPLPATPRWCFQSRLVSLQDSTGGAWRSQAVRFPTQLWSSTLNQLIWMHFYI